MYQVQCHVIVCNGLFLITSLAPSLFFIEVSVYMYQVINVIAHVYARNVDIYRKNHFIEPFVNIFYGKVLSIYWLRLM